MISKILLVDDDPSMQQLFDGLLPRDKIDLHTAANLAEAQQEYSAADFNLVILDQRLPDGNGLDFFKEIRAQRHPGLAALPGARRVLVLGGGDGLAVREILRYPAVESVTLVDLDPEMTRLFSTHPLLVPLNGGSLKAPRVHVINADAFPWLEKETGFWDFAVVDFPDPTNYSLGKLYTTAFYRLLARHLNARGMAVVQSTSPLFARQSYWCIAETMKQAGFEVHPYHAYVPSFGEWGFVLGALAPYRPPAALPPGLRFLNPSVLSQLFDFPADMGPVPVEVNRLNDQVLVRYYDQEWGAITH